MWSEKYIVIALVLACAAWAVQAIPTGMDFRQAKDLTICKTKVEYNRDENRIPKTIKMLTCADEPYEMCPTSSGDSSPCCGARPFSGATEFSCLQVFDYVAVKYGGDKEDVMKVPVGCSCLRQTASMAAEVD